MTSMRRVSAGAVMFLVGVFGLPSDTHAYNDYAGGCQGCHGDFRSSPYISLADGADWGDDLHDRHRNLMLGRDCDTCHGGSGNSPVYLESSDGGLNLPPISCMGCHGRQEDEDDPGAGWGAGLRQHHYNSGVTLCTGCHADSNPANYTPVGEDVLPPYYNLAGSEPDIPDDSCNPSGSEDFLGTSIGLDNDGDLDYDGADSDCAPAQVCGDMTITLPEVCETGDTDPCQNQGVFHADGTQASCAGDCLSYDTAACAFCGDGDVDGGFEICEVDADCAVAGLGYAGDVASCLADCSGYDDSACRFCGDAGCDGADGEDAVTCASDCPQSCGDGLVTGAEACELGSSDGCENQGAFHADGTLASCAGDCLSYDIAGCAFCGDLVVDGGFEACDGDVDCSVVNAAYYTGDAASCAMDCSGFDLSACRSCGDGVCDGADGEDAVTCASDCGQTCGDALVTGGEACELGNTDACENQGTFHADGTQANCASDCLSYDIAGCAFCGDLVVDGGFETCDGDVDCSVVNAIYYAGDAASCAMDCSGFDLSACRSCGDGVCDGADGEDAVTCASDCAQSCGDALVTGTEICELGYQDACQNQGAFHANGSQANCAGDCLSWDSAGCASCGDGNLDPGFETCDGDVDCSAVNAAYYAGDAASCAMDCSGFDLSACRSCGDGVCDGADGEDAVTCASDCAQSCGDGLVTGTESCEIGNIDACQNQGAFHADGTQASCAGDCSSWDTAGCASCGDGTIDAGFETCDGDVDCSTISATYYAGDSASCAMDCSGFDLGACRSCGDGTCDVGDGENSGTCAVDCPASCGDGMVVMPEICEVGDMATCESQGAFHADGAVVTCAPNCLSYETSGCVSCGDGNVDAGFETCDGDVDCNAYDSNFYAGDAASCAGDCSGFDVSACRSCGDGVCDGGDGENAMTCAADCAGSCGDGLVTGGESCELSDLSGCENQGAFHANGVQASCAGDCLSWDTAGCASCGDGNVDAGFETCDGDVACSVISATYYAGDLAACAGDCTGFDLSACRSCGDGVCDGGDGEDAVSCASDCAQSCGDGLVTGGESCELGDMDVCENQGAFHADGAQASCAGDCMSWDAAGCASCGDGNVDAGFETCDGDIDCNAYDSNFYAGDAASCAGDCSGFDVSACRSCGDGVCDGGDGEDAASCAVDCAQSCGDGLVTGGESCELGDMDDCENQGAFHADGTQASCAGDCLSFDIVGCAFCGDLVVDAGFETCDGDIDCNAYDSSFYAGDPASCAMDCSGYDVSACRSCGDGVCDGGDGEDAVTCPGDCSQSCGDGLVTGTESCELGASDACENHGAFHADGTQASCAGDCLSWVTSGCATCGDGDLDATFEVCDGNVDCSAINAAFYAGDVAICAGDCSGFDASACRTCGDGVCDGGDGENAMTCPGDCSGSCGDGFVTGSEVCELGQTDPCEAHGAFHADGATAACAADCMGWDTVACAFCGDGATDAGFEVCESAADCASVGLGYAGEMASCAIDCSGYDASACRSCGDGVVDALEGEECDGNVVDCETLLAGGFTGGSATCDLGCILDLSACTHCGDGACNGSEDVSTCFVDCDGGCGDGFCGGSEDYSSCPADCTTPPPDAGVALDGGVPDAGGMPSEVDTGGCGCHVSGRTSPAAATWPLLIGLAIFLRLRRRRRSA